MMQLRNLLLLCSAVSATQVLIPLYTYPGNGGPSNWKPVLDTIAAYPSVFWSVIINPDSGPKNSTPDTDFAPAVATLNSYSNVQVIGYVHSHGATIDPRLVKSNITKWAGWNKYANVPGNPDTTIAGIFFDETPNIATSYNVTYMTTLANFSTNALKSSGNPEPLIVYNPGALMPAGFFNDYVDLVVQFEDYYSVYSSSNTIASFTSGTIPNSAVLAHNVTDQSTVSANVQKAKSQGLGAIYLTVDGNYFVLDKTLLTTMAAALA